MPKIRLCGKGQARTRVGQKAEPVLCSITDNNSIVGSSIVGSSAGFRLWKWGWR